MLRAKGDAPFLRLLPNEKLLLIRDTPANFPALDSRRLLLYGGGHRPYAAERLYDVINIAHVRTMRTLRTEIKRNLRTDNVC
jgi:hypothetical protein